MTFFRAIVAAFFLINFQQLLASDLAQHTWRGALIASIVSYLYANPLHSDAIGIEAARHTQKDISGLKLLSSWGKQKGLIQTKNYRIDTHFQFNIGYWRLGLFSNQGDKFSRYQLGNTTFEISMNFRHLFSNYPFFLETNVGIANHSKATLGEEENGGKGGFVNGVSFGYPANKNWHYVIRVLHYSNNDTVKPNPPNNFIYFGVEKAF